MFPVTDRCGWSLIHIRQNAVIIDSTRMTPPRFIEDLIYLILESDDHWWPRDLLRLARVSPAWLAPVRNRLYVCPSLRSFRACGLLARTLTENPCLQTLLHGIDIRPSISFDVDCGELSATEMASLRYILNLDGLRSLTLGGELAVHAERFLHSLTHPDAVTELNIHGSTQRGGHGYFRCRKPASLEWDEVMAFKFPNLRKLQLSDLEIDIMYPPLPYSLEVTDLYLDNIEITSGYLPHLFHDSWSSLRHLSVIARTASDFDEHLRVILDCCSPGLEALHYEVVDARSEHILFDDASTMLPSLRHLRLSGVDIQPHALSVIQETCRSLEDLSVTGRVARVSAADWVLFLNSGALPSLRHLSIPWGTYRPPFVRWQRESCETVLDASTTRKIHLSPPDVDVMPNYGRCIRN